EGLEHAHGEPGRAPGLRRPARSADDLDADFGGAPGARILTDSAALYHRGVGHPGRALDPFADRHVYAGGRGYRAFLRDADPGRTAGHHADSDSGAGPG